MDSRTVFTVIYGICFAVGLFCMVDISRQKAGELQLSLFRMLISADLMLMGYWFQIIGTHEEEMIIAQKLILTGGSFVFFFMFMFFVRFCHTRLPRVVVIVLSAISIVEAAALFSFNQHKLAYSKIYFGITDGLPFLKLEPAFFGRIFRVILIGYVIAMYAVIFVSRKKNSSRRIRQEFTLSCIPSFILLEFVSEAIFRPKYTYLPITIALSILFLMFLIYYKNIFDIHDSAREIAFKNINAALITVNSKERFQDCNPLALQMFPELRGLSVNESLDTPRFDNVRRFLKNEQQEIMYEGHIFENKVHEVIEDGKVVGYVIWLNDVTGQRELVSFMKNYQLELEKLVDEKTRHIIEIQSRVMLGMSDIIESRDGNTGGHVKRTRDIVGLLTDAIRDDGVLTVEDKFLQCVTGTAPMHDIGKLAISDSILQKPGKLTDEEYEIMKTHSARGAKMVDKVLDGIEDDDVIKISENIAHYHHERWDGKGYPDHLAGERIPLEARIMAIADVYDALVSKRCYKEPMSFEKADEIMQDSFGTFFDPGLKKYYDICRPQMEDYYSHTYE